MPEDEKLPRPPFDFTVSGLKSASDFLRTEDGLLYEAMMDYVHHSPGKRDIFADVRRYIYQVHQTVEQTWSGGHAFGSLAILKRQTRKNWETHELLEKFAEAGDEDRLVILEELRGMYMPGVTIGTSNGDDMADQGLPDDEDDF